MSENVSTVIDSLTCYTELTMEQQTMAGEYFLRVESRCFVRVVGQLSRGTGHLSVRRM